MLTDKDMLHLLTQIDALVNTDQCAEWEAKLIPGGGDFTQKEAQRMAKMIAQVYSFSHQIYCEACAHTEKTKHEAK